MDIYAIFNSTTGVYQAALIQGSEQDGGEFDFFNDERFTKNAEAKKSIMSNSTDWIQISEEDFQKYKLGTHGGDNDTGYIYDFSTGKPISAPARILSYDEKVQRTYQNYKVQLDNLKDNFINASIADDSNTIQDCKVEYQQLFEKSNEDLIAVIGEGGEQ